MDLKFDSELVDVGALSPHPRNPRRGDVEAIKRSIQAHGFIGSIVCDQDGVVVVGNHRLEAAKELGMKKVPTVRVTMTEEQALGLLLDDNRTSDLGDYDDDILYGILQGVGGTDLYDDKALEAVQVESLAGTGEAVGLDEDATPESRAAARAESGIRVMRLTWTEDDYKEVVGKLIHCGRERGDESLEETVSGLLEAACKELK
jgi:site-specific DNA-methyltransferase (adenine-specific)